MTKDQLLIRNANVRYNQLFNVLLLNYNDTESKVVELFRSRYENYLDKDLRLWYSDKNDPDITRDTLNTINVLIKLLLDTIKFLDKKHGKMNIATDLKIPPKGGLSEFKQ